MEVLERNPIRSLLFIKLLKRRTKNVLFCKKFIFWFNQETAVAPKRIEDSPRYHIITKQTSVQMDSARDAAHTYKPDDVILDMTGSSDSNFEVSLKKVFFVSSLITCMFLPVMKETKHYPAVKKREIRKKRNKRKWHFTLFVFAHVRIFTYVFFASPHTRLWYKAKIRQINISVIYQYK